MKKEFKVIAISGFVLLMLVLTFGAVLFTHVENTKNEKQETILQMSDYWFSYVKWAENTPIKQEVEVRDTVNNLIEISKDTIEVARPLSLNDFYFLIREGQ